MSAKNLTDSEIRKLTNLDALLGPRQQEHSPDVPSDPAAFVPDSPKRSTTDPLEINFYQVDIIEGLGKQHVKAPVRWFAWLFLAGPLLLLWPFAVFYIFEGASEDVRTFGDLMWRIAGFCVATMACGFWPYILLRGRQQ